MKDYPAVSGVKKEAEIVHRAMSEGLVCASDLLCRARPAQLYNVLFGLLVSDVAHTTMFLAEPELKDKDNLQTHMHMCAALRMQLFHALLLSTEGHVPVVDSSSRSVESMIRDTIMKPGDSENIVAAAAQMIGTPSNDQAVRPSPKAKVVQTQVQVSIQRKSMPLWTVYGLPDPQSKSA